MTFTRFAMLAAVLAYATPAAATAWMDQSVDSLKNVFDIDLSANHAEELAGPRHGPIKLYLSDDASVITWPGEGDVIYVYRLTGESHDQRALALYDLLRHNRIVSFVAERHGARKMGSELRNVMALRFSASMQIPRGPHLP